MPKISSKVLLYILKKIMVYAITLIISFSIIFVFLRLVPGNPISRYVASIEQQYSYRFPKSQEKIDFYIKRFGLDQPMFIQYVTFITRAFFEFDLGPSMLDFPKPAQELIMRALPWSLGLLSVTTVLSWVIGVVIGVFLGWKRGSKLDNVLFTLALGVSQIPYYSMALILLFGLSYALGIFPNRGAYSPTLTVGLNLDFILDVIYHSTLPALSLVIVSLLGWMISSRAITVTILGEDYLLFAQAKGLKKIRLLNRYILRNVLLPQATGLAISLGFIVNGFYLVEWIFSYPGIGSLLVRATNILDYNVLQGIILISIFTVLSANMIIDIVYPLIDPRIKRGIE